MLSLIKEIKIIHLKDLVLYLLESGEIITYSLAEDSAIVNREAVYTTEGTDGKLYSPVYNGSQELIGFVNI